MMEHNFSELSKDCATHEQFICVARLVKKVCFCRTEYSFTSSVGTLKKIGFFYIEKLDDFVKTINSRVNRITKLTPNKVTKQDVPRLVSLSAETTVSQKPRSFVGDFVRVVKKDKSFREGFKQSFTDKIFEITHIPTLFPPSYSLIDPNKEQIEGKFYQSELQFVRERREENE